MADPVWATLAKSQDDPTTIGEAIAAAIASHEASPESHMGVGESIDVHRTNDIIDHPAGSVVGDKGQTTFFDLTCDFRDLTGLSQTGEIGNSFWPGMEMRAYASGNSPARLKSIGSNGRGWLDYTNDFLVQTSIFISEEGPPSGKVGFGQLSGNSVVKGIYLSYGATSDVVTWKKGTDTVTSSNLSLARAEWHTLRFQYSSYDRELYVYLNGVLVSTLVDPNTSYSSAGLNSFIYEVTDGGSDESLLMVEYLKVSIWPIV